MFCVVIACVVCSVLSLLTSHCPSLRKIPMHMGHRDTDDFGSEVWTEKRTNISHKMLLIAFV